MSYHRKVRALSAPQWASTETDHHPRWHQRVQARVQLRSYERHVRNERHRDGPLAAQPSDMGIILT